MTLRHGTLQSEEIWYAHNGVIHDKHDHKRTFAREEVYDMQDEHDISTAILEHTWQVVAEESSHAGCEK